MVTLAPLRAKNSPQKSGRDQRTAQQHAHSRTFAAGPVGSAVTETQKQVLHPASLLTLLDREGRIRDKAHSAPLQFAIELGFPKALIDGRGIEQVPGVAGVVSRQVLNPPL